MNDIRTTAAVEKAIALSKLDPPVHVLPCWRRGKDKGPSTPNGFYDATSDEHIIRELWQTRPGKEVGIWPGASRLLIEDIDVSPTAGVNGFNTLDRADVPWESKLHYPTPSGGEHHVWPAFPDDLGPAAPIAGFPGVDRRSGNSLCLWYGPVPSQKQWAAMHQQNTPNWLQGASQGRKTSSRPSRVITAEAEEVTAWIESLTDGPAMDKWALAPDRYGDLLKTLVAFVEHTRSFPTWPGTRATFDVLASGYLESEIATTTIEERPRKIVGILRWALGATADVEDMTWALERFGRPGDLDPEPVPDAPPLSDDPGKITSRTVTHEAGTASTPLESEAR
jgi:hypothetical protein